MSARSKARWLPVLLFLTGCGKEVGRVPFSGVGSNSAVTTLHAGKVAFWTDVDLAYVGSAALEYRIALVQGGTQVATAVCDALGPMGTKLGWFELDLRSGHSRRGRGEMLCSADLGKGGPTTVDATLAFGVQPLRANISRADLVVKQ